jgi:hypothetical protein
MAVIPLAAGSGLLPDVTVPTGCRFEVARTLSAGGFGIAYLAHDRQFDDLCVVKELALTEIVARDMTAGTLVPLPGRTADVAYWVDKVVREARLLNRIRHEAVVTVRAVWQERGTAYYAMDHIDGVEFPSKPTPGWDWKTCEPVFRKMLEGLEAIHAAGLVHSDIKPSNILISRSGQPVFIDFGTARTGEEMGKTKLTTVAFTPGYAPPELESRDRGKEVGPWSDLYSLAMVFIGLFAIHPGLEGSPLESRMRETLARHSAGADPYNEALKSQLRAAGMPHVWVEMVMDCVAVDPSRRPRSVAACVERLEGRRVAVLPVAAAFVAADVAPPERVLSAQEVRRRDLQEALAAYRPLAEAAGDPVWLWLYDVWEPPRRGVTDVWATARTRLPWVDHRFLNRRMSAGVIELLVVLLSAVGCGLVIQHPFGMVAYCLPLGAMNALFGREGQTAAQRFFGLETREVGGSLAGPLRLVCRQSVLLGFILVPILLGLAAGNSDWLAFALYWGLLAGEVAARIKYGSRGLQDLIAGTVVVRRDWAALTKGALKAEPTGPVSE